MGIIFDIKEFAVHDGKGMRTSVFFKGCPLRCAWCHNPEGLSSKPQLMVRENSCKHCGLCLKACNHKECKPFKRCIHICPDNLVRIVGEEISAEELAQRLLKNSDIISKGGITFTGGEPLMQADFLLQTISYLSNINIAIETSGYCDTETFKKVIDKVDYVFMDIKLANNDLHIKYTGVSNSQILNNLQILKQSNKPCTIRTPLIPNITDTKENLNAIKLLIGNLKHELIPYNTFASIKYKDLGITYPLDKKEEL